LAPSRSCAGRASRRPAVWRWQERFAAEGVDGLLRGPKAALEQLENEIVTMKVTLSYFIEPNLTGRAATRPDTYRSFGLRFAMKRRNETEAGFRARVNAAQEKDSWRSRRARFTATFGGATRVCGD
jgi:hypothetical protein